MNFFSSNKTEVSDFDFKYQLKRLPVREDM